MADDPWADFRVGGPAQAPPQANPQAPGVIYGRPKPPPQPTTVQVNNDARASAREERDRREWDATHNPDGTKKPDASGLDFKPTEFQSKSAGFYERMLRSEDAFKQVPEGSRDARTAPGQFFHEVAPNVENYFNTGDRQVADQAALDFIRSTLRQESGASVSKDEEIKQFRIFFPMPGDGPEVIAQKEQARKAAMEGMRIAAGPLSTRVDESYRKLSDGQQSDRQQGAQLDTRMGSLPIGGPGAGGPSGPNDPNVPPGFNWANYSDSGQIVGGVYDESGQPLGPQGGLGFDESGNQLGLFGSVTYQGPNDPPPEVTAKAAQYDKTMGETSLLQQGMMGGLGDEASGIGEAISGLFRGNVNMPANYRLGRDAERLRLDKARQQSGFGGTAAEFFGGMMSGGAGVANALTPLKAAAQGATLGGVSGFGYGEGLEGSATNALLGASLGAGLGYGGGQVGARMATRNASKSAAGQRVQGLADAGAAEGVTVNRAMAAPKLQNRVTGVDASLVGGPRIQSGMRQVEGQIEGRVSDLGRGGTALNSEEGGNVVRGAAERFIDKTGKSAARKYDRAEKLAGAAKVEPRQSLAAVDQMIAQLSETPGQNSAEISFLETLKSDLSQELSVGALRRMRTSLRKRINNGGLTFGEDEGRVLAIMDNAADDIRTGLAAQGNQAAADAFDAADKSYRARMSYINDTIQKVVGKRNSTKSAEDVFRSFSNMAKGKDAAGLRKFYATLEPDEAADVAATFADELGKNNKGEFSVAHFLSQSEKLSDSALVTIFGKQGAESVKNLRLLGTEADRVTGAMNSRKSGTSVGNDYRSWLFNMLLGLAPGAYSGNAGTALAGAAAVGGIKATRDVLSARALLSPKLTKWISQAPRTQTPAAINSHFERLGEIARIEPGLAQEIEALRSSIMQAANDNAGRMGSAAASPEQGPDKQQ